MATAAQHRVFAPRISRSSPATRRAPRVVAARASSASTSSVGAWDLEGCPDGIILKLARRLEGEWKRLPNVRDAPCAPELKSVDAVAPDGDPATRIRIENLCLQTDAFRKMHLEVAWGLGGLEVLHCVIYPWAEVSAPIFAADLVAFGGRVTLCIADVSPTALDLSLPEHYLAAAKDAVLEALAGVAARSHAAVTGAEAAGGAALAEAGAAEAALARCAAAPARPLSEPKPESRESRPAMPSSAGGGPLPKACMVFATGAAAALTSNFTGTRLVGSPRARQAMCSR